jgi:SAM-dependent methyltransferase
MGNLRWLRRSLQEAELPDEANVVELGAGDGALSRALAEDGHRVTAVDLSPPPEDLPRGVRWLRGDMFEELPLISGDALVANLFWHHFSDEQLDALAPAIERFPLVMASEPHRARFPNVLGAAMVPFVNGVTRHDLFVSIRAGFQPRELAKHWRLDSERWRIEEQVSLLGACRFIARQRKS